mmetsp:Transcript_2999/g.8084  ORF Transcript_2999/g.8084 Transcript_2999/m.8084 type:complete len:223 (-) Transcript_2999:239-907(-)
MLSAKYPEVTGLNRYLNNFSEHKGPQQYSIGKDDRFKLSKSASCPGPGHYRCERDYPVNELDDMGSFSHTGCRVSPKYTMPVDSRMTPQGIVKGLHMRRNHLGPGQYSSHRLSTLSSEKSFPSYTMPSAKETAEAVRDRKKASDVPGPGVYNIERYGDALGKEKTKAMERAVKRGTNCWASATYSHLFTAMKPRSSSTQRLPPEANIAGRPFEAPPENAPTA